MNTIISHKTTDFLDTYYDYYLPFEVQKIYDSLLELSTRINEIWSGVFSRDYLSQIFNKNCKFFFINSKHQATQFVIDQGRDAYKDLLISTQLNLTQKHYVEWNEPIKALLKEIERFETQSKCLPAPMEKNSKGCLSIFRKRLGIIKSNLERFWLRVCSTRTQFKRTYHRHPVVATASATMILYRAFQFGVNLYNHSPFSINTEAILITTISLGIITILPHLQTKRKFSKLESSKLRLVQAKIQAVLTKHKHEVVIKLVMHHHHSTEVKIGSHEIKMKNYNFKVNVLILPPNEISDFEFLRVLGYIINNVSDNHTTSDKKFPTFAFSCLLWQLPFPLAPFLLNTFFRPPIELPPNGNLARNLLESSALALRIPLFYASSHPIKEMISLFGIYQSVKRHQQVEDEYGADLFASHYLNSLQLKESIKDLTLRHKKESQNQAAQIAQNIIIGLFGISFSYYPDFLQRRVVLERALISCECKNRDTIES